MKISLMVIGKTTDKKLSDLISDYSKRVNRYLQFDITYINDIKNTKNFSEDQQKAQEGDLILKNILGGDYVVLLDEHGKEFTSIQFSKFIEKKMITVPKRLIFIVGGPYGFSDDVQKRADEKLSLSKMTFPHEIVRLFFVEQMYRAMTIMNNEPYHHE